MNETSAIRLCLQHKDPVGFEFLVHLYHKKAFFYSSAMLGNPEDAKDACQEAYLKAFAAIGNLKDLPRFYPWFVTILRNCCLNMISRKKTSLKYQQDEFLSAKQNQASTTPENEFVQNETEQVVWRCLQDLKPEHKEILILKYFQDCRYNTISSILGIPKGTVMSRLYSARKAFKNRYQKENNNHSMDSKNGGSM